MHFVLVVQFFFYWFPPPYYSTNIPDPRRRVTTIVISPMGNLATLVDGFGRVMLLDVESLVIRRMWKGVC